MKRYDTVIMHFFCMRIFYNFTNTHGSKENPHNKDLKIITITCLIYQLSKPSLPAPASHCRDALG